VPGGREKVKKKYFVFPKRTAKGEIVSASSILKAYEKHAGVDPAEVRIEPHDEAKYWKNGAKDVICLPFCETPEEYKKMFARRKTSY
jgi:hypothetical protein